MHVLHVTATYPPTINGVALAAVESEASRDWVREGVGTLTANDPEGLAKGILQVVKKDKAAVARKAKEIAGSHTSAEKAKEVLSAYESAIERLS